MEPKICFTIRMADLNVSIKCRYESVKLFCKDYIVDDCDNPDIIAFATDKEISDEIGLLKNIEEPYAESLCIYRSIARQIPAFNCAVFHGASITYKDDGLLFTAPSGTGKSTHISLWRKYLGEDVRIVNGDKPILRAENGVVTIYGTPWAGKENWQRNVSAQLKSICFINRGTDNTVKRMSVDECITAFMYQIYMPDIPNALQITLGILGKIIESVPAYRLSCDMSEDAVKASFEALIGEKYKK